MGKVEKVKEFHRMTGAPIRVFPEARIPEAQLRQDLIEEEFLEYCEALRNDDVIGVADALADLLYVVYGAALSHGIPIDVVFDEVHRSNMTKTPHDKRYDGKIQKGPTYSPPDINGVLRKAVS